MLFKFNTFTLPILLLSFLAVFSVNVTAQTAKEVNNSSPKWESNSRITLEFISNLGELDHEDDNYLLYLPGDIAFDIDENIYILDAGNHRIQKFDKNRKFLKSIGREGQGPGELKRPISLDVDDDGNMYVCDEGNSRIQVFDKNGKSIKTIPVEDGIKFGLVRLNKAGNYIMGGGGLNAGFGMMMMEGSDGSKKPPVPNMIKTINKAGKVELEFAPEEDFGDMMVNRMANTFHFSIDKNENVYINYDSQNKIEKYSPSGKKLLTISRKLNYDAEIPHGDQNSVKQSGGNIEVRMPKLNKTAMGVAVDSKGRIWSVTYDRQLEEDETVGKGIRMEMNGGATDITVNLFGATDVYETDALKLEIFDEEGTLLQEIPITHFVDNITIKDEKVYLLDSMRGSTYYVYKINEK